LACRVALIRYRRVSRNSAALIFPSIKHFLLQPFPLDLIRHRCVSLSPPIVMILSRSTLLVILDATFSSRQEITPASYRARTNHTIRVITPALIKSYYAISSILLLLKYSHDDEDIDWP
jgi:hypothetical protein